MFLQELESKRIEKEHELQTDMESALLLHGGDDELSNVKQARKERGENIVGAIGTVMTNVMSSNVKELEVPVDVEEDVSAMATGSTGSSGGGSGDSGATGGGATGGEDGVEDALV